MASKANPTLERLVMYTKGRKADLIAEFQTDPRFQSLSDYCLHLITIGRIIDKKERQKAIDKFKK